MWKHKHSRRGTSTTGAGSVIEPIFTTQFDFRGFRSSQENCQMHYLSFFTTVRCSSTPLTNAVELMLLCGTGVRLRTELIAVFLKRLYDLLDIFQTDETAQYRCQILLLALVQ